VRLCQDFLADARAADEAPSAAEYATFLIDFAENLRRDRAVAGLGLGGRRSQLFRRVVRLLQRQDALERSCPRRWNAQVTLAACAVVLIAGGLRAQGPPPAVVPQSSASPAASDDKERAPSPDTLALTPYTGTVRDIESGQPLEGATVHFAGCTGSRMRDAGSSRRRRTGPTRGASIGWPSGPNGPPTPGSSSSAAPRIPRTRPWITPPVRWP